MLIQPDNMAMIRSSLDHWKDCDVEDMAYRFREDAALSSAFFEDQQTVWLQGRDEVLAHLKAIRAQFSTFNVLDVATDTVLYVVTLQADAQILTVVVEPEIPSLLIRKIIVCRSIFKSMYGDQPR